MDRIRGFTLGFFSLLFQVLLIREVLNILSGNEISIITFFFIWLGGILTGAILQSFVSLNKKFANILTILDPLILSLLSLFSFVFIRYIRNFLNLSPGEIVPIGSFFFVCLGVLPLSFFVGFSFPLILKSDYGKISPSELYFYESAGSIFSCVIFTFLLAGKVHPALIIIFSIIFSIPLLFKKEKYIFLFLLFAISFSFYVSFKSVPIKNYFDQLRWKGYKNGFSLLISEDTKYQNLSIGKLSEERGIFVNGSLFTTFPDPYMKKLKDYFLLLQNEPKKILIIGGGYEEDLNYFLKYKNLKSLYYVELDPKYIEILNEIGVKVKSSKLKIFFEDGRKFLRENREKFDLIILNVPTPANLNENRFFTLEFFKLLKKSLSPNGIISCSLPGKENYLGKDVGSLLLSLFWTLKNSFKNVVAIPGEKIIFIAKNNNVKFQLNLNKLVANYKKLDLDKSYSPYAFTLILQPYRIKWLNNVLNSKKGDINRDFHPELFFKFLKVFNIKYGSSKFKRIDERDLKVILDIFYSIFFLILIFLSLNIIFGRNGKNLSKYTSYISMFIGGFSGMALLLLYIYLFQIARGYVYSFIGFIFAVFMAGLAAGSFFIKREFVGTFKKHLILSFLLFFLFFFFGFIK